MNYPLISEYIESIRFAEDNFATLTNLRPVLDKDGNPIMSSGNFAVVFKMQDIKTQKYYALKCFIKDQPERAESYRLIADELEYVSSEYLVHVRYLEKELFVCTTLSCDTEFPALLMDWVEGVTLDKWIKRNLGSQYSLQLITHQFCRMASWLISQPFAHGDLKPDNIIVRDDGSLVLVDYDGMYVPAMQGKKSRESGSPDYRHPARTEEYFNEHIDDFSLAAIAMQLCAIALDPALFANQNGDTLLLTERDHRNPAGSTSHQRLHSLLGDTDFERLYALYHLARAQQSLSNISFRAFQFPKPEKKPEPIELSTKVTDEDMKNGVKDEFGALYSPDGLRLLKGPYREHYHVRQGTRVICDGAFSCCFSLSSISIAIPDSVTHIGDDAFSLCHSLSSIAIPDSVTHIGANPFRESGVCRIESKSHFFEADDHALYTKGKRVLITFFDKSTSFFAIPDSVTHIGDSAFESCHSLSSIAIPNSVTHIGDGAFESCYSLSSINIPDSVTHIGDGAFSGCFSLSSINIPNSVTHIGANPFLESGVCRIECKSHFFEADDHALYTKGKRVLITFFDKSTSFFAIPDSVTHIGDDAFSYCLSLSFIAIPDSVTHIGTNAFWKCSSLSSINIPNSVTHIGDSAFSYCESLSSINIPDSVTHIGDGAFESCYSLSSIAIPDSVTHIGNGAFDSCYSLSSINIPDSVTHIGNGAFDSCHSLSSIAIPDSVTHIGDDAFFGCESLSSINIPDSVTHIGDWAFSCCYSLSSINIPDSVTHIGNGAFDSCYSLSSIAIPRGSRAKFEIMLPEQLHNILKEQ